MVEIIERDAVISECSKYRYLLRRVWDHERPRALFVMLNPSTADAEIDDPTIRSCVRLTNAWMFGSFEVVNLFAWRATNPKELLEAGSPIGPRNDDIIDGAKYRCDLTVCAWGAHAAAHRHYNGSMSSRAKEVQSRLRTNVPVIYCLGTTKAGDPKHPLYIKTGTPPVVYTGAADG